MDVYLHHIDTLVPEIAYDQQSVGEAMKTHLGGDRKIERLLHRIYRQSGIDTRHSVVPDLDLQGRDGFFLKGDSFEPPSTQTRNALYIQEAKKLFSCLAQKVLQRCPTIEAQDVSHVITVSCTGFFAPGPDYHIVRELGLRPETGRYHVGFMGCYAAFPALKMARAFCEADPDAVVLVVSVELCTLHLQASTTLDSLIASSVFADGASAAVVSARAPRADSPALRINDFATTLVPQGEADMAWTIGDSGFDIVLSSYVPAILEANIAEAVTALLKQTELDKKAVDRWAVHPGGRAILDKVARGLELSEEALDASRKVLKHYGNMSSATILFVLQEMLQSDLAPDETVCAMAFGPGLTVESGLFSRV